MCVNWCVTSQNTRLICKFWNIHFKVQFNNNKCVKVILSIFEINILTCNLQRMHLCNNFIHLSVQSSLIAHVFVFYVIYTDLYARCKLPYLLYLKREKFTFVFILKGAIIIFSKIMWGWYFFSSSYARFRIKRSRLNGVLQYILTIEHYS